MSENQSLQFSVKESVWFERGQQVSEVLSMSLDPDITIQEHEQYISIRGALQLSGEYYPSAEDKEREVGYYSLRENRSFRTVDEVREVEEGLLELAHKFPIDITIPMNRVDDLNDVYVMVESFDYDLPEDGRLQLSAELSISGIVGEKKKEVRENKAVVVQEPKQVEEPTAAATLQNEPENTEEKQDPFYAFELEARKAPVQEEAGEQEEQEEQEAEADRSPQIELKSRNEEQHVAISSFSKQEKRKETVVEQSEEPSEEEKEPVRDENALYLTKILSSEGEGFSKLRLRIVQHGETLDTIAHDYDVSLNRLVQMNRLADDHVGEGAIIYIPETVND